MPTLTSLFIVGSKTCLESLGDCEVRVGSGCELLNSVKTNHFPYY